MDAKRYAQISSANFGYGFFKDDANDGRFVTAALKDPVTGRPVPIGPSWKPVSIKSDILFAENSAQPLFLVVEGSAMREYFTGMSISYAAEDNIYDCPPYFGACPEDFRIILGACVMGASLTYREPKDFAGAIAAYSRGESRRMARQIEDTVHNAALWAENYCRTLLELQTRAAHANDRAAAALEKGIGQFGGPRRRP